MWCWVKFVTDKSEMMRPLKFFENFETIKLEKNKEYQVFWSKEDADTPEKQLKKEGKILHVDNIKKRNSKKPIPGYYRAVLLQFAETVEELEKSLNEKRMSFPLKTKLGNYAQVEKNITSKEKMMSNSRKRNISVLIGDSQELSSLNGDKDASSSTIKLQKKETQDINFKYENQEKKIKALNQEVDELKIKLQKETDSKENALEKLKKLENSHKVLEEEIQILRSLNYELQRKLVTTTNPNKTATPTLIESQTPTPVLSPIKEDPYLNTEQAVNSNEKTAQPFILYEVLETSPDVQSSSTIPIHASVQKTQPLASMSSVNIEESTINITHETPVIIVPPASTFQETPETLSYPNDCMLTKKQYEIAKKTAKIGELGDSQFTKNLADVLWEREKLALRSVTGARSRKKGEDGAENEEEPRPACTPEKKACIKQLFNFRMNEEEVELKRTLLKENRLARASKINKYLKAKIGTVRSQLGLK